MANNNMDPEKGLGTATVRSVMPSSASSAPDNTNVNESSKHIPLELFQLLIGIHTPASLEQGGVDGRGIEAKSKRARSENVGLYQRAKERERANRLAYLSTSFVSNTLFLVQILLAATFTGMSAYKDSNRVTLTVLGAWNTVLAG